MLPLKSINVVDCSTLLPGPYCTMMLSALGAEVIKVETPNKGDFLRKMYPEVFQFLNQGKRSISLNLKTEKGREIFYRLVQKADVLMEGFRPGVAEKLGIDFERVSLINPRIIYTSISGFGQSGPYAEYPGHDIDFQAFSGLISITGDPDQIVGMPTGFPVSDIAGAMFALVSILTVLVGRKSENDVAAQAIHLDISLADSLLMWMMPRIVDYFAMGNPDRADFLGRGAYGVFQAKDQKYFTLGVVEEHFWERLCHLLDLPDLLKDPELKDWKGRNRNRIRIMPRLQKIFLAKERDTWVRILREADIPTAPVHEINNLIHDPQVRHRGLLGIDEEENFSLRHTKPFPEPKLIEPEQKDAAPKLGQDTELILKNIGITAEEFQQFRKEGVV